MYEKAFSLEIIAPDKMVYQGQATSVSAPGSLGGFQILFDHAPMISSLNVGPLKVKDESGQDTVYATGGGVLEVRSNNVVVLVESAELPREIDIQRAEAAKTRAEERLKAPDPALDVPRAELALARALNRLRLAGES